jgi:Carboxypeptidase regulatory-like domain/TonB dependent receptor
MKRQPCFPLGLQGIVSSRAAGLFVVVLWSFTGQLSRAQSTTGDITGTVTDNTGAVVPGATVTLINTGTHEMRSATTSGSGDYTFTLLNPGSYSIRIEESGFSTANIPEVALAAGDRAREDAKLQVGSSAQTVQVTAQAPALQTDSSVLTSTVTEKAVQDLPLDGRNYINLAQITPGANEGPPNGLTSGARPDDRRQTSSISVNGQSDVINDELVDGLDNNERIIGTIGIRPSVEAIKEINVQSNTYTAEVGRTAGGVINIITKSGSNNFHGSVYEFFRNDVLDATPFQFGARNRKPELRQNQFGGSLGGPIVRDKVFFFGDYEGLRQVLGTNPIVSQVPTQDQYNLLRSNPAALAHGPVDPVGLQYALLYPAPNGASTTNGATGSFVSSPTVTRNSDTWDGRVDVQFNPSNLLYGRYTYNRVPSNFPGRLPIVSESGLSIAPGGNIFSFYGAAQDNAQNTQINYIHTFSSRLLLQLTFGYTRINNQSFPLSFGEAVNQTFGQPNVNLSQITSGLSPASVSGLADLGDGNFIPIEDIDNTYQYQGSVTLNRGAHTIKIGAALIRRQALNQQNNYGIGSWSFNPIANPATGTTDATALAALLQGRFQQLQRSNSLVPPNYRTWEPSVYFQDDWHASSKLSLNLGLRYDIFTPFTEVHNALSNFDPATASIIVAGQNGINNYAGLHITYTNVAPRVGFAYSFLPGWVLRGGFGLTFVPENYTSNSSLKNQPFVSSVLCQNGNCQNNITQFRQGPPLPTPASAKNPSGQIADTEDRNFRPSYLEQFNLTLEKDLAGNIVQATYVGTLGRHLASIFNDQNVPAPVSNIQLNALAASERTNVAAAFNTLRPYYQQLPNVTQIGGYFSTGTSSYNALQVSLTRRTRAGLTVGANYTLAHGLDDVIGLSNEINDGYGVAPSQIHNRDYGNSDVDIRNRGVVTANYEIPFGNKVHSKIAHSLASGWQANTLLTWESGEPFTVTNSQDIALTTNAGFSDRPNQLGRASIGNPSIQEFFDTAAFVPQTSGTLGTARKNPLYGPNFRHVDLSVFKSFPVYRESTLEFRAEAFNITNLTNFSNPNASLQVTPNTDPVTGATLNTYSVQSSAFGQITSTSPNYNPREFQFALKYQF